MKSFAGKRVNWLLIKHRDAYAHEGDKDALLDNDASVASGRALADIAAGKGSAPKPFMASAKKRAAPDAVWDSSKGLAPALRARGKTAVAPSRKKPAGRGPSPAFIEPQLCRSVDRPPSGADWLHEIKFDGYRIQAVIQAGHATLYTRKGLNWTSRFAAIAAACAKMPDAVIDGEIVALGADGAPRFCRPAGGTFRRQHGKPGFLYIRSVERGGRGFAPGSAHRPERAPASVFAAA